MALSKHTRTRLILDNGVRRRAHRVIMERHLGRPLEKHEQVHHKNGDPLDNRIENLEVILAAPHMRLHKQVYPDQKPCVNCGKVFTVNPRKRTRSKCCSQECAMAMRIAGRKRQSQEASSPKSQNGLEGG